MGAYKQIASGPPTAGKPILAQVRCVVNSPFASEALQPKRWATYTELGACRGPWHAKLAQCKAIQALEPAFAYPRAEGGEIGEHDVG